MQASTRAMSDSGNVRVVCRVRPQNASELALGGTPICNFDKSGKNIIVDVRSCESSCESRLFPC